MTLNGYTVFKYKQARDFIPHSNALVLDIGCGSGIGCYYLTREKQNSVIGIDISTKPKHQLQNAVFIFIRMDCLSMGFRDNCFDAVTLLSVIEHLSDPPQCLKEIQRILKPGGTLLLSTPNRLASSPMSNLKKPLSLDHTKEYSPEELRNLLEKFFLIDDLFGVNISNPLLALREKRFRNSIRLKAAHIVLQLELLRILGKRVPTYLKNALAGLPMPSDFSYVDYTLIRENLDKAKILWCIARKE